MNHMQDLSSESVIGKLFSLFLNQKYVEGTKKIRRNRWFFLAVQTYAQNYGSENICNFTLNIYL